MNQKLMYTFCWSQWPQVKEMSLSLLDQAQGVKAAREVVGNFDLIES